MCAADGQVTTDEAFARAYLHSGMVGLDGEKMSKSRGNLVFVSALRREGVDPMAIRLALLSQHYRTDWMWSPDLLVQAQERLAAWREAVRLDSGLNADGILAEVRDALDDDLDAPRALAAIDGWADASLAIDDDDAYTSRLSPGASLAASSRRWVASMFWRT
jgi:L-cysteine:1D-myo-inositol 2-amino-2-deoxy-alpha-D-glucopyranoside ligase